MRLPGTSALTTCFTGNIHPFTLVPHSITTATTAQAVNSMIVNHVESAVRDSLPVPCYPSVTAMFAKVLCPMIFPGDKVCVFPNDADNIFGRAIDIEADHDLILQSLIPVHPDSTLADDRTGPLLCSSTPLTKRTCEEEFPILSVVVLDPCQCWTRKWRFPLGVRHCLTSTPCP